jgi:hypothetical protein
MKDVGLSKRVQRMIRHENEAAYQLLRGHRNSPKCSSETVKTGAMGAIMKNQIDISTIVDAVYETVLCLTGDVHQARWDAYWTLTTLRYPEMEEAA